MVLSRKRVEHLEKQINKSKCWLAPRATPWKYVVDLRLF